MILVQMELTQIRVTNSKFELLTQMWTELMCGLDSDISFLLKWSSLILYMLQSGLDSDMSYLLK